MLYPFSCLASHIIPLRLQESFEYRGFCGPKTMASEDSFRRCANYQPTEDDIFIATQMKCGTTWMQHIVFQILHHGAGEFDDDKYKHMYAVSPWIETDPLCSVALDKARPVSQYKKRIIKTHMPVQLCPFSQDANYIYVARHPVSCFASMVDFLSTATGPFCLSRKDLLTFFCSEKMWWGPWINHVQNWLEKAQGNSNIHFVVFEQLKDNAQDEVAKIADFLDVSLTAQEMTKILEKVDFQYMKKNNEYFEMVPPNIFSESTDAGFFVRGNDQRQRDVSSEERQAIIDYCKSKLKSSSSALIEFYPELG